MTFEQDHNEVGEISPSPPALIYVFIGNKLPKYSRYSLKVARRNYNGPIVVLVDHLPEFEVNGVRFVDIRPWYDSTSFKKFKEGSNWDPLFRGGFTLHAAERFFVLTQFFNNVDSSPAFHLELDVMPLMLEGFARSLDQIGAGIFIPIGHKKIGIASLVYINAAKGLEELVNYFLEHPSGENEMTVLASYLNDNPKFGFGLSTEGFLEDAGQRYSSNQIGAQFGLVDGAAFGQWIFGVDPRNSTRTTRNHYPPVKNHYLRRYHFKYNLRTQHLRAVGPQGSLQIRALHIHAKNFSTIQFRVVLAIYIAVANFPFDFPIQPKWNQWADTALFLLTSKYTQRVLVLAARMIPRVAGSFVEALVEVSPTPLSNKRRAILSAVLPKKRSRRFSEQEFIDASLITEKRSLPRKEVDVLSTIPRKFKPLAKTQLELIHLCLESSKPILVGVDGEQLSGSLRVGSRTAIFLATEKDYEAFRHFRATWKVPEAVYHWSFSKEIQLIEPNWVAEMFPSSSEVERWLLLGLNNRVPTLSFLQSYAHWAWAFKRNSVFVRPT